uniref:Retrotransposon gag domain-containing protein n=1 Tax=Nicotiana tabacum TaxID=4097 RepID=A0A1S4A3R9_TOBAC
MKMPSFKGTRDPDLYLDWERKVEAIFDFHNYSEGKKVKLVVVEFSNYATIWWKKLTRDRLQEGQAPVATWAEMKRVMRKRFVPSHFQRELQQRLQTLKQGPMSVDEYFKAMDMAMIQANCTEEEKATMVAGQNKRKQASSWKGRTSTMSKKPWPNHEMKSSFRPQEDKGKGRGHMMHECPSRRNIILKEDGGYESEKSEGEEEGDVSDEDDVELPNDGMVGDFEDVFPENIPYGLPPLREIEHQIDFVPGSQIPNRPAYRSNPEETKELQSEKLSGSTLNYSTDAHCGGLMGHFGVPKTLDILAENIFWPGMRKDVERILGTAGAICRCKERTTEVVKEKKGRSRRCGGLNAPTMAQARLLGRRCDFGLLSESCKSSSLNKNVVPQKRYLSR